MSDSENPMIPRPAEQGNNPNAPLRDRIAAALQRTDQRLFFEDEMPIAVYYAHVADAVIAELGLYREGRESQTVTNEQGATYRIEGGHRYVTDWKADDE